jgi:hydroxyacylglutathione hydrolase
VPIEGPHPDDLFWIEQLDKIGGKYGLPAETFEPDRWLDDGDTVTVGEQTLRRASTAPATHQAMSCSYTPEGHLAIVGDVLFQGSIGRTDFPRGNHQQLIDSITQKLWPLGNDVTFLPGHGPTSTFGRERQTNGFVSDYLLAEG